MPTSFHLFGALFLPFSLYFAQSTSIRHVHIVYLGINQLHDHVLTTNTHYQLLSKVFASEGEAKEAMIYSYKHSCSGFSAMLDSTQATTLAKMDGVISVFRSRALQLHTTRSWDFLGLTLGQNEVIKLPTEKKNLNPMQLAYGDDIVVGIFDTGIWPESESFKEEPGMRPVPFSWKGTCIKGEKFDPKTACNRKLIGARYYLEGFEREFGPLDKSGNKEYRSARDFLGHGTHTASTAVGSIVKNASFFGLGSGTARGGAPRARLAVYKVCWSNQLDGKCMEADILAAFDDALRDGVHVISASFGESPPLPPFFSSSADIGSFHAMQADVSVVFSAGNSGLEPSLVANVAPWCITVAASSIDRAFPTQLIIDSNFSITGDSFNIKETRARLVASGGYFNQGICSNDQWNGRKASGRFILCFSTIGSISSSEATVAAFIANASGLIFAEPMTKQIADVDIIPTIRIDLNQGTQILNYIARSPKNPTLVVMLTKTMIGKSPAPVVAYFSSRGPSSLRPDILKPDVSAPGLNILAAWPPLTPPTLFPEDKRSVSWNLQPGTSMSCPHVSGVVALLKSAHPTWSAAAIKSALMTTAYTMDNSRDNILAGGSMKLADSFDIGAGQINPLKAMDPGLVYDMSIRDYIIFLCSIGYDEKQIETMVRPCSPVEMSCPKTRNIIAELNFPSILVSNLRHGITVKRTLRNVCQSNTIYFASIVEPEGVKVTIRPKILIFSYHWKEISYYVTFTPSKFSHDRYDFGEIVWSDGIHRVRTPLVVSVDDSEGANSPITRITN